MDEQINIDCTTLNQSTIRQNFCCGLFDLIQFTYIFNSYVLSKDFLRELMGMLNHCQLLEFHSDVLSAAKITRVLSNEFLTNAITFLKECRVDFWISQFAYFNAIQKFEYRLKYQYPDNYKKLHEVKE